MTAGKTAFFSPRKLAAFKIDMEKNKETPEQLAQWVIDNRHSKGENQTTSDFEIFHHIVDGIKDIADSIKNENQLLRDELQELKEQADSLNDKNF